MHNHIILEAYMKSYREYFLREADKARDLKFLNESLKEKTVINQRAGRNLKLSPYPVSVLINKSASWIYELFNSLFNPRQHCETC